MHRHSPLGLLICVFPLVPLFAAEPAKIKPTPPEGILPLGADGKSLNLDFETGTLKDWKADGEAFAGQPIKGDTVAPRRGDMKSQHQGTYWIGTYERKGDQPQGTLTSVPFKVTHPWASFLVGGGPWPETCVQLVRNDTKKVFSTTSGLEEENMRRVAVDLRPHLGKEIFIRLVDKHSGHWGHINFDDFRFHSTRPPVLVRKGPPTPDTYKYAGLPPEKAAQVMTVPEGFTVTLFAGEPDVRQPIAMCLDHRGRVWVAEAYSYPIRRIDKDAHDRIVIFEDTKGTGKFDKRTVFMEGLNLVSGLEVGFGGVWIGAAPYLMFVPMAEGEDKPAGKPQILLDGWHYEDTHETLNAFCWGPDGWLYGCHGVFTHSRVGKPGTPDRDRIPINAGVWRYHPTKHIFEVFAHGTSNPWGLDFDANGQAFVTACVIPHAFHIVQGGRYTRQAGAHFNPYTYADIPTIADHLHWEGANQWAANYSSGSKGGGHAHCGLMIYQGLGWPNEYRGRMFFSNIHGHRINMDILKRKGSGFVASHGPDFILANDSWARFINLRYGPGNVYLIDWYDKQACHRHEPEIWDRSNGRIYKISYRGEKSVQVDLTKKTDLQLVNLQLHKDEWFVRHARRVLQERAAANELESRTRADLARLAFGHKDETARLRGLWALHVTGGLTEELVLKGLSDTSEYLRAWSIQLALEGGPRLSEKIITKLVKLAKSDDSPVVHLYLASAAQRMGPSAFLMIEPQLSRMQDATDPNLPLMNWYALEALVSGVEQDPTALATLFGSCRLPLHREFMARRIASIGTSNALDVLVRSLARETSIPADQKLILRNTLIGLRGRRNVPKPTAWDNLIEREHLYDSKDPELRSLAYAVAVVFGDIKAFGKLRGELASKDADMTLRQAALTSLLDARDKDLAPTLQRLVGEKLLRAAAIRGLASYDHPKTPDVILAVFPSLTLEEKRDALNTLASRAAYGKALLEAIAKKKIEAATVPAEVVRQLRNLNDKTLDKRIGEVWGIVRATPADRAKLIADYRKMLTRPYPPPTDLSLGRAVFAKVCQQCHTLYGVGGKVGPDITGSNRSNLDYLLENILDPSAVIPNDYKATRLELANGRVVTGIIRGDTTTAYTVLTANETLTIPRADVDKLIPSDTSMMPDDLLKPLTETEVRALIGYLRHSGQVTILATPDNSKDLFNGKDLTGWDGDPKLWKVENGEIVGKSPGIKKNEFLKSQMVATDFRLTLKVKLAPNKENSGVQIRSEPLPDGEVKGPQADVGLGWWGKLYEEQGRGVLSNGSGEKHIKVDDWNEYEIVAQGSRIKTFINGHACVDLDDPKISRRGIFALQIHSGGPMEVRFKDIKLEVLTDSEKPAKK
jgi:putative membrane-bound dehydrogenase-like protein